MGFKEMGKEEIRPGYDRISDIASAFGGYGRIPQKIMDYAGDRGERCHSIVYDLMNDIVVKEDRYIFCNKSIRGYIDSWQRFANTFDMSNIMLQENRLYMETPKVTGQVDLLVRQGNQTILLDWKTSKDIGKHWAIQASGYCELLKANNINVTKILFVKLDKDGGEPVITEYSEDKQLFLHAHDLYVRFFKDLTVNMEFE